MQIYVFVDCNGMLCKDGGQLDINTCTCSCKSALYYGDQCENRLCGTKKCLNHGDLDPETCECSCRKNYSGEFCENSIGGSKEKPVNDAVASPQDLRPCGTKKCLNRGDLDPNTCECSCKKMYSGEFCENCEYFGRIKGLAGDCCRTFLPIDTFMLASIVYRIIRGKDF